MPAVSLQWFFLLVCVVRGALFDQGIIRRLIGSNCFSVERGSVPRYYSCLGCVIEEAQGCVDDLRLNRSGNVPTGCDLNKVMESYEPNCCPVVASEAGRLNLLHKGAGYVEALKCIDSVGCADGTIYTQLYEECQAVCGSSVDPRNGGSLCEADYNEAHPSSVGSTGILSIVVSVIVATVAVWSSSLS
jgi:hypothetical protein